MEPTNVTHRILERIQESIATMHSSLGDVHGELHRVHEELHRVHDVLGDHGQRLERVERHVVANSEILGILSERQTSSESASSIANGGRVRLDSRVDRLESRVETLEPCVDALESRVDTLEPCVDALESRVDTLEP